MLSLNLNKKQKKIFKLLLLMAAVVFIVCAFPNAVASKNSAMVQIFEPDEAAPLPFLFNMVTPAGTLTQTLKNFIFYNYYFYGFPHFALSAFMILPLQWFNQLDNIPLVMLILRQMISVLPMLFALLILVYLQDGFRTYRSLVLFAFLSSIPAVFENNFWWHPDGLVTLFVAATLFFLVRDRLRFGRNFFMAAIACGLAIATKLIGLYFFLAVGLTLVLGLYQKKITIWKSIKAAFFFFLLMGLTTLIFSPYLLSYWERSEFIMTMSTQSAAISEGWGVRYAKGLSASWPLVQRYYGEMIFLFVCLGSVVWGIFRSSKRLLFGLILAWFIPLSVMVFFFSHFKYQYWMPAVLPVLSCVAILLPEKLEFDRKQSAAKWFQLAMIAVVVIQFGLFLNNEIPDYVSRLHRAENNPSILFYDQVVETLKPVQDRSLNVYYDYRMYLPSTNAWTSKTTYDILDYGTINENNFDVLLLLKQRFLDYLNPKAVGIDSAQFANSQQFYRDAQAGAIRGYHQIFENDFGKLFIRDDLYQLAYSVKQPGG
jgi:hypothetical protein